MESQTPKSVLNIPVAIIVAGALIALAVIYTNSPKNMVQRPVDSSANVISLLPVSEKDHVLGNPNAPIVFVEYSDTECPFCKVFHSTMHRIIDKYGKDGKVAWVYRHLPITNLHPRAWNEAIATECVAKVTDSSASFWKYIDRIYEVTESNNKLDPSKLVDIAREQNVDIASFTECLDSKATQAKVQADYDDGVAVSKGRPATPTSVILLQERPTTDQITALKNIVSQAGLNELISIPNDSTKIVVRGAFPYDVLSLIIDLLLQ